MKKFVLFYFLYVATFYLVVTLTPLEEIVTNLAVSLTSHTINLFGIETQLSGRSFLLGDSVMMVEPQCSGLDAIILFVSVILAYPSSLKVKLLWAISSIFVVQFLNTLRITLLAFLLLEHKNYFDLVHLYIAPFIMVSIALLMFYIYTYHANSSTLKDKRT